MVLVNGAPIPQQQMVLELDPADCLPPEGNRNFRHEDCATLIKSIDTDDQLVAGIVCRHPMVPGKYLSPHYRHAARRGLGREPQTR